LEAKRDFVCPIPAVALALQLHGELPQCASSREELSLSRNHGNHLLAATLLHQFDGEDVHPGRVAAGTGQAGYEADPYRVVALGTKLPIWDVRPSSMAVSIVTSLISDSGASTGFSPHSRILGGAIHSSAVTNHAKILAPIVTATVNALLGGSRE
jgi:hypothetical protein